MPGNFRHIKNLRYLSHNDKIQDIIERSHHKAAVAACKEQKIPALFFTGSYGRGSYYAKQHQNLKYIIYDFKIHQTVSPCFSGADGIIKPSRRHLTENRSFPSGYTPVHCYFQRYWLRPRKSHPLHMPAGLPPAASKSPGRRSGSHRLPRIQNPGYAVCASALFSVFPMFCYESVPSVPVLSALALSTCFIISKHCFNGIGSL